MASTTKHTPTAFCSAGSSGPLNSGAPAGSRVKVSVRPGIAWKNSVVSPNMSFGRPPFRWRP